MKCDSSEYCCYILNYRGNVAGWEIEVFNTCIVALATFTIAFFLTKLKQSQQDHLSIYPRFIQITIITFIFVDIIYLIGTEPSNKKGHTLIDIIFKTLWIVLLGSQWWIQLAIPIFMCMKEPDGTAVRKTVLITSIITFLMIILSVLTLIFGCKLCGIIATEVILTIFFSLFGFLYLTPWKARPASLFWSIFQALAHGLFCLAYLFGQIDSEGMAHQCGLVLADVLYYLLYGPLLFYTLKVDSSYWQMAGPTLLKLSEQITNINQKELILKKPIGRGGYSEVYSGLYRGIQVAVKRIRLTTTEKSMIEEATEEASFLHQLRHPNVISLLGLSSDSEEFLCIVTELCSLGSLWNVLHDGKVERSTFIQRRYGVLHDIAKAIFFLHSFDPIVIHRDLKSQNILITHEWVAKLADFGISRFKEKTQNMTQTGTPQYMAPEVLSSDVYSEKCDIYSFGVIAWETMTFKRPWEGVAQHRVISIVGFEKKHLEIPTTLAEEQIELIGNCLKYKPEERWSAKDIIYFFEQMEYNTTPSIKSSVSSKTLNLGE